MNMLNAVNDAHHHQHHQHPPMSNYVDGGGSGCDKKREKVLRAAAA